MVDKMFLRIPAFEVDKDGIPRKIEYDIPSGLTELMWRATSKGKMTKQQRDNMMIDIEFAILTSQEGSEQVSKPGNFDTVKQLGRISRILESSPEILKDFIRIVGGIKDETLIEKYTTDAAKVLEIIRSVPEGEKGVKVLNKFLEKYDSGRNALTPQTYNYFHTLNMTGASLVGLYANGASIHTKSLETLLSIKESYSFKVNGREIRSLHDIYTTIEGKRVYILELIAEMQQASVDNAKDPVLADLYLSMMTGGTALLMLRAGLSLEELAFFFSIKRLPYLMSGVYRTFLVLNGDDIDVEECNSKDILRVKLWQKKYPALYEVLTASVKKGVSDEKLRSLIEKAAITDKTNMTVAADFSTAIRRAFGVLNRIENLRENLKPANDIMKADSPNNAIALGFPGAILQRHEVSRVNAMMRDRNFPFEGVEGLPDATKDEFISNGIITISMTREEREEALMERRLPAMQAFYSLGIELPLNIMQKWLILGNSLIEETVLTPILNNAPNGTVSDRDVNIFYRELMTFLMTDMLTFGGNLDVDRYYYLYEFPLKFRKTINKIPELKYNLAVSRLGVTRGDYPQIVFNKTGKMTPLMKASIRRDFSRLLYSDNAEVVKFAKDIFMYSFFKDGFNYGSNSFGTYFDSSYWNAFPEVVRVLRTLKKDTKWVSKLERFKEQYIANHSDDLGDSHILPTPRKGAPIVNVEGSSNIQIPAKYVFSPFIGNFTYIRIPVEGTDDDFRPYKLISKGRVTSGDQLLEYLPAVVFDEPKSVYDANRDASEMQDIYFNDRKKKLRDKKAELKKKEMLELLNKKALEKPENETKKEEVRRLTETEDSPSLQSLAEANYESALSDLEKAIEGTEPDTSGIEKILELEDPLANVDLDKVEERIAQGLQEDRDRASAYLESLVGQDSAENQVLESLENKIKEVLDKMNRCKKSK